MVNDILVVGAGGHCRVVLSILRYCKDYNVIGIADRDSDNKGEEISGSIIKYSWNDFQKIYKEGTRHAVIAVGDNNKRKELFIELSKIGFALPSIVHPSALIEKDAVYGEGNVICIGVNISSQASIGNNCILYTGSVIEHETRIGDHVFIGPGCNIAGRVTIEDGCFIGIGSSIKDKIHIGQCSTVGAGSVVIRNVNENEVVAGVPAKKIK